MLVTVCFYSYFKDLTGCAETTQTLAEGTTLGGLWSELTARFPKLAPMHKSALMAVGLEYQQRGYVLREGERVSFFPPVQGG